MAGWPPRRKRKASEKLIKFLYYLDEEQWYVQYRSNSSYDDCTAKLAAIYDNVKNITEQYWSLTKSYLLTLGITLLFTQGVIDQLEFSGFSLSRTEISFPLAAALGTLVILLTRVQARLTFMQGLFNCHFNRGDPASRTDLLARFPESFSFIKYRLDHKTVPQPLMRDQGFASQIVLVVFVTLGAVGFIAATGIVYIQLAYILWHSTDYMVLGKAFSAALVGITLTSYLVPQGSFLRKRYIHYGLVNLLRKAEQNDSKRYSKYVRWIYDAHEKMFPVKGGPSPRR